METFAKAKTAVLGSSKNLGIHFAELRQIVSLLLSDNMEEYPLQYFIFIVLFEVDQILGP